jgi:4-hydroxy-2-oxoheptanedioate aldolase
MPGNRLRQIWAEGRPTINGWLSIGNAFSAEIMAAQGYDSLTIDGQHGALDYSDILPMLQAMRASGVVPMVRVPWLEPGAIMKALDAGAFGIICPMVNTAAEAAEFVSYMRYAPLGTRSFGPTRVTFAAGADYARNANADILAFAMVETAEALANVDAIAATPGLDGIYVGPSDLTLSVTQGRPPYGLDREEPEMIAHFQRIATACKAHGVVAAIHCGTPEYAQRAVGWGYGMTTVGGDVRFLSQGAATTIARFRELTGTSGAGATKGGYG